jgi:spermidine synthase
MKKYSLEFTVFLCGAALMILELAGSRVLAPYIGTSIVVWTSLIGIIMGALSLGYYFGGKIADRGAEAKKLSFVIIFAAFLVAAIVFLTPTVFFFISWLGAGLYFNAVAATTILFALPSFLLGIVSPYAVKLKMNSLDYTGRTVGDLYALSTLGSIAGTFAAGFLLIPFLGTTRILYFTAALLVLASLLAWPVKFFKTRIIAILFLLAAIIFSFTRSAQAKIIDVDSQYNRIFISSSQDSGTKRPILRLTTDPYGTQSAMFTDRDDDLVLKYSKYYRLGDVINPNISRALIIGGAAYSYPKDFLKNHPTADLDVVEIDSKMTELAKKYFNLKEDTRLKTYTEDARVFLNENQNKYDAIFVDAFNSHLSIPYQLTTREAVQEIYNGLNDNGVVIVNIISAIEGDRGKFLRAEYSTYKSVFPQVYLFRVYNIDSYQTQNLILIAAKSDKPIKLKSDSVELRGYLETIWPRPVAADLPILTDDYAPVDYYALGMLR